MNKLIITTMALAGLALPIVAQEAATPSTTPAEKHGFWQHFQRRAEAWKSLTPEEQQKLKAAHKAVKGNPEVAQARANLKESVKNFHEVRKAAMLKADPSIAPILEKLETAKKESKGKQ